VEEVEEDNMAELSTFTWIAIFAISAAVINGLGILTIYKKKEWAERSKTYFMCFAAGVLISVPLMSAFPEAVEKNSYAGFLLYWVFCLCSSATRLSSIGPNKNPWHLALPLWKESLSIHS
jgi:zinc transporter ZupT